MSTYRRSFAYIVGIVMLSMGGCMTIVDHPTGVIPRFSGVDTVFAIQTSSQYYPLVFRSPVDSMHHSLSNGYVGTYWLSYNYGSGPRWEFAFPSLTSIDSLGTVDGFEFFGASEYTKASVVYPNTYWRPGAVLFTYRQVVLARPAGKKTPIYCFEGGTGSFQPSDNSYTIMIRYMVYK